MSYQLGSQVVFVWAHLPRKFVGTVTSCNKMLAQERVESVYKVHAIVASIDVRLIELTQLVTSCAQQQCFLFLISCLLGVGAMTLRSLQLEGLSLVHCNSIQCNPVFQFPIVHVLQWQRSRAPCCVKLLLYCSMQRYRVSDVTEGGRGCIAFHSTHKFDKTTCAWHPQPGHAQPLT